MILIQDKNGFQEQFSDKEKKKDDKDSNNLLTNNYSLYCIGIARQCIVFTGKYLKSQ